MSLISVEMWLVIGALLSVGLIAENNWSTDKKLILIEIAGTAFCVYGSAAD
jgi:hypothetical protein